MRQHDIGHSNPQNQPVSQSQGSLPRRRGGRSLANLTVPGTTVENLDWQDCIKRYDRPHTFFYLDPPYWQVEGYGVPFEFDQYEAMASIMRNCSGNNDGQHQ